MIVTLTIHFQTFKSLSVAKCLFFKTFQSLSVAFSRFNYFRIITFLETIISHIMNLPNAFHRIPREFTLRALETDYSLSARDVTFEVCGSYYVNGEAKHSGRTVLTGWGKSASLRFLFCIRNPVNEKVAQATLKAALCALGGTIRWRSEIIPDYMTDFIIGIPLGFRVGKVTQTDKRKVKRGAILHDAISDLRDALTARVAAVEAFLTAPVPA